jgi:hypothetical protein
MRGPSRFQALHFIPESAETDDPAWSGRFHELANAMVMYGAKSRLIQRFTGLKHKEIVQRCQILKGCEPAAGRLRSIKPARFVTRFDRSTNDFLLQCAAFAQCLTRIESAFTEPLNRGWLLVMAYRTYDRLSERLVGAMSLQKLDINVCWELMVHFGNARFRHLADIAQKSCSHCGTHFLALNAAEETSDFCPMCGIQQYYQRLTQAGLQRAIVQASVVAEAG